MNHLETGLKNRTRSLAVIISIVMLLTGIYFFSGQEAEAASKPRIVSKIGAKNIKMYSATVYWSKVKKNVRGYAVYKNGRFYKNVSSKTTSIKEVNLNGSTTYKYKVRAYNIVKQKQWYNKKTKKWQKKKPSKRYRGKYRTVKMKVYGSSSPIISFKTTSDIKVIGGVKVRAKDCPKTVSIKDGQCPNCKVYGQTKARVTFKNGKWETRTYGTDYSDNDKCHHCNSLDYVGTCEVDGKVRTFVSQKGKEGELKSNGTIDFNETFEKHYILDGDGNRKVDENDMHIQCKAYVDPKTNQSDIKHIEAKANSMVYCFDCEDSVAKPDDLPAGWPTHK